MAETHRQKILVVDDSEMNRSILADMLDSEYDIIEAEDGLEAISILQKHSLELSLVLLDVVMPKMDGFEVLALMNQHHWIDDVPVIMITAEHGSAQMERAYELGVTDFIPRPFDTLVVRRRVVNTILLYAKQKRLMTMVEEQIYEKEQRSGLMIDILSNILEFRNGESGLHVLHVRTLTELFLMTLVQITDRYHLTSTDIANISTASALHDIGKIAIDEKILNKPGRLTDEEFTIMKTHALIGAQILAESPVHQDDPLLKLGYEICRWHHERYDGKGYPDGLKGDDIPISAQVVALADVYDALTSERVYKDALPHEEAVAMILRGECGSFSPLLLECLSKVSDQIQPTLEATVNYGSSSRVTIQNIADEVLRSETHGASERTLRLLDHERTKYNFFAELTEDIQFEYTVSPSMLSLSAWGAERLGLDEIIMNPENDQNLRRVMGEANWARLAATLQHTTPEAPEARIECLLHLGKEDRWHRIIMQSLWSEDGQCTGILGKALDIHDTRQQLLELERKAFSDSLTGLCNYTSAREAIRARLSAAPDHSFALVLLDLDHFKAVNDTHGHQMGDNILKYVAQQLSHSIRGQDISARVGGDEFLIFLEYESNIERVIERIHDSLALTYEGIPISVSLGVALSQTVGYEYDDLFRAADQALCFTKGSGRGSYTFYDSSMLEIRSSISEIDNAHIQ